MMKTSDRVYAELTGRIPLGTRVKYKYGDAHSGTLIRNEEETLQANPEYAYSKKPYVTIERSERDGFTDRSNQYWFASMDVLEIIDE